MIYFIQRGDTGPIKIGFSVTPTLRLRALQIACAEKLRIALLVPGGVELEQRIHDMLNSHRIRGEWFRPDSAVFAAMAELAEPAHQYVDGRPYAVLFRASPESRTAACPFCGATHLHGREDGHRVAHCSEILRHSISLRSGEEIRAIDGYVVRTNPGLISGRIAA